MVMVSFSSSTYCRLMLARGMPNDLAMVRARMLNWSSDWSIGNGKRRSSPLNATLTHEIPVLVGGDGGGDDVLFAIMAEEAVPVVVAVVVAILMVFILRYNKQTNRRRD